MIEQNLSLLSDADPLNSYNVAQLQFALTGPKSDNLFVNDLSPSSSPAIIPFNIDRRMSSSGTSAADTDSSSILSRPEKRHLSPSLDQSPTQVKKLRQDNHHHWGLSDDHTEEDPSSPRLDSDNNNNSSNNNNGNSKVSLPSIFTTFEDPFRHAELRRSSAPSLCPEATRARPSPYPRRNTNNNNNNSNSNNNHASNVQSSLSTYQFPPPSASPPADDTADNINNNSGNNKRPRLSADTQFGLGNSYPDQPSSSSTYSTGISSSSAGTGTTPASSAASFPLSSTFTSPLTPDYLSRSSQQQQHHHHPNGISSHYTIDSDWSPAAAAAGIIRPSSTPGQLPGTSSSSSPMIKYEDSSMRHSSFSAAPPQMYAGAARISGHQRGSLSGFGSAGGGGINMSMKQQDHEWSFPAPSSSSSGSHQDFVLPSNGPSSYSSPNSMAPAPPFMSVGSSPSLPQRSPLPSLPSLPSQSPPATTSQPALALADRPPRKRGKLPKETTDYLKAWLHRHSDHPYPSEDEKKQLCHATGLSMSQVSNWMINARRRILAPAHRAASGPTTTTPFPPSSGRTNSLGAAGSQGGGSMDSMGRRASMPADNLQLYHPLSLQTLSNSAHHANHSHHQQQPQHQHQHQQHHHQNAAPPPEYMGSTRQLLGLPPAGPTRSASSSSSSYGGGAGLYVSPSAGMHSSFTPGTGPMSAPATLPSNSFHGGGSHHHQQPLYSLSGGRGGQTSHQDGYYADGQS